MIGTGDLGDNDNDRLRWWFALLRSARRPAYSVIGNHDEWEPVPGTPDTATIEGPLYFNQSAPFNRAVRMVSGDGTVTALGLILECNIYDDDPLGIVISPHHSPGDRCGANSINPGNGWHRLFSAANLAWVQTALSQNADCDMVLLFVHFPPAGTTFTNYADLIDLIQADGRPCVGFSGHVHQNATSYTQDSTDHGLTVTFYKMPATVECGAWCRVTLSMAGGAISVDEMELQNYTDPGGYVINAPFTVAP